MKKYLMLKNRNEEKLDKEVQLFLKNGWELESVKSTSVSFFTRKVTYKQEVGKQRSTPIPQDTDRVVHIGNTMSGTDVDFMDAC